MKFRTIITVGPSILCEDRLREIASYGDHIFRINGAHVTRTTAERIIREIRKVLPGVKIMLDLPGNKIRTLLLPEPIRLAKGECFYLYDYQLNYKDFYKHIKTGDVILANDSLFTFEVVRAGKSRIKLLSRSDGILLSGKGLHIKGIHGSIPFMFEKDRELIKSVSRLRVDYIALSFVRSGQDVAMVKEAFRGWRPRYIAKIEKIAALDNLEGILNEADSIIIDRGDLSSEIGLTELPWIQEKVIMSAKTAGIDVYLATQFLTNMVAHPVPLISEVMDLHRTLASGVSGIQLSEETAVGKYPAQCVKLVYDLLKDISERRFSRGGYEKLYV